MFKLIKKTDWTASNGNKGTTYVVAYKGRVFTFNGEDFPNMKDNKGVIALGETPVVVTEPYITLTGEQRTGLRLKPAIDLAKSDF